jgi:hypothetical protein
MAANAITKTKGNLAHISLPGGALFAANEGVADPETALCILWLLRKQGIGMASVL